MSLALAGVFLSTGPPRESKFSLFIVSKEYSIMYVYKCACTYTHTLNSWFSSVQGCLYHVNFGEKPRRDLCLTKVKNQSNSSFLGIGAGPLISQQEPGEAVSAGVGSAVARAGERSWSRAQQSWDQHWKNTVRSVELPGRGERLRDREKQRAAKFRALGCSLTQLCDFPLPEKPSWGRCPF